jgi:hypothetical protein
VYAVMTSSSLVAPQDITLHLEPPIAGSPPHSISNTMSFVKLSIFGTSFEVNLQISSILRLILLSISRLLQDMSIFNPSAWVRHFLRIFISLGIVSLNVGAFGLVWYALSFLAWSPSDSRSTHTSCSSAKDQLTGASVAIKKIMKPFSTPVLSKRTYRELKLLKHIQHENVSLNVSTPSFPFHQAGCVFLPDHQPQRCLHLSPGGYVRSLPQLSDRATHSINLISYFVTELLGTDLHRLLTSRPLEKQFIQYFLYQILVRLRCQCPSNIPPLSSHSARAQVCALGRCRPSRSRESLNFLSHSLPHIPPSETKQHPRQ